MIGGRGCCHHHHHIKLNRNQSQTRTRHLSTSDVEIITDIGMAQAKNSMGSNVFYVRSGQVITRSQVRYLNGFHLQGTNHHFLDEEFSDADKLISLLENQCHSHVVLYHQNNSDPNQELLSEIKMPDLTKPVNALQDLDDHEINEMHNYVSQNRGILLVQSTQALMIGVAWVTGHEKRLFQQFPYVLKIDSTMDTNKENRPLLVITGRDNDGKSFTVLRAYLPNQRMWTFHWIFQTVIPALLGQDIKRTSMIITDGDSQEITQLDNAILQYFPQVFRQRCGWHLVTRGWDRYCPARGSAYDQINKPFYKVCQNVLNWLYSWLESKVETEMEYKISKALLFQYLTHPNQVAILGNTNCDKIVNFIREHVVPYEQNSCFFHRISIRHYDECTNSSIEGSFGGMKYSSMPVNPQHSVSRSACILSLSSEIKNTFREQKNGCEAEITRLWCVHKIGSKCSHLGAGLLQEQWFLKGNYISCYVASGIWHVVYNNSQLIHASNCIPVFHCVRIVTVSMDNFLKCSCYYYERTGIPCRHIWHVMESVHPNDIEPKIEDVCVTWLTSYKLFAFNTQDSDNACIDCALQNILKQNIPGPQLRATIPVFVGYQNMSPSLLIQSPTKTCLNYSEIDIIRSMNRMTGENQAPLSQTSVLSPIGVKQSIVNFDNNSDDDNDEVVFPIDDETSTCHKDQSQFYYQQIMPRCQELIQLFSDGAATTAKQFISLMDETICNAKEEIRKEKRMPNLEGHFISVCLPSNK